MKSTGIIRRIDDLGRIVIPKEIRNLLNIQNDDNIEIYIENKNIILSKYDKAMDLKSYADKLVDIITDNSDIRLFITNKEIFITKGILENNKIDNSLQNLIIERKKYESSTEDIINNLKGYFIIYPIIIDSDLLGLFIFFKEKEFNNQDKNFANIILKILENR
ncbi:MAG: AbrB/MazE/SpoVT family DNA-binding domain-containing protein [bacterium]|nr:AbrB/MazE/SpoVT family DNA-binding domain-containing protein [bacterium]